MKNIPLELRKLRVKKGFTQAFMAQKLSISIRAYSKIERGETQLTLERLYQISSILNTSVIALLKETDSKTKDKKTVRQIESDMRSMKQHYEEIITLLEEELKALKSKTRP